MKFWIKVWQDLEDYVETFHWGYIGAGIFLTLFGFFVYDSLASSQISLKFLLVIVLFMGAVYYFGDMMFGGMASPGVTN